MAFVMLPLQAIGLEFFKEGSEEAQYKLLNLTSLCPHVIVFWNCSLSFQ